MGFQSIKTFGRVAKLNCWKIAFASNEWNGLITSNDVLIPNGLGIGGMGYGMRLMNVAHDDEEVTRGQVAHEDLGAFRINPP